MNVSGHHAPAAFPPWKKTGTHWIGSWLCPRDSLDLMKKRYISCLSRDSTPGPSKVGIELIFSLPATIILGAWYVFNDDDKVVFIHRFIFTNSTWKSPVSPPPPYWFGLTHNTCSRRPAVVTSSSFRKTRNDGDMWVRGCTKTTVFCGARRCSLIDINESEEHQTSNSDPYNGLTNRERFLQKFRVQNSPALYGIRLYV